MSCSSIRDFLEEVRCRRAVLLYADDLVVSAGEQLSAHEAAGKELEEVLAAADGWLDVLRQQHGYSQVAALQERIKTIRDRCSKELKL